MIYYERPKVNYHRSQRSRESGKAPHPLSYNTLPEEWSKNSFIVFDHMLTNFTYSHTETESSEMIWQEVQGDRRHERPKARAHNVSPHSADNIERLHSRYCSSKPRPESWICTVCGTLGWSGLTVCLFGCMKKVCYHDTTIRVYKKTMAPRPVNQEIP